MYPNPFESQGFAGFWLRVDREWAEAEKRLLYYPEGPCDFCVESDCSGCENNPQEEPCDYGFSEECVEPQLRDTNCCFECWLFMEVDAADRRSAKQLEEETVETEVET
jgi:hypothetical protein